MDNSIYVGFATSELSKLLMYSSYYDKLQLFLQRKIYTQIIWIVIVSY